MKTIGRTRIASLLAGTLLCALPAPLQAWEPNDHFKVAHQHKELFPSFDKLSVWEYSLTNPVPLKLKKGFRPCAFKLRPSSICEGSRCGSLI